MIAQDDLAEVKVGGQLRWVLKSGLIVRVMGIAVISGFCQFTLSAEPAKRADAQAMDVLVAKLDENFTPIDLNDQIAKSEHWICRFKNRTSNVAVRSLRIYQTRDGGCRATYTKGSEESLVGASRESSQCTKIVASIRDNLTAGNWACKQASVAGHAFSRRLESEVIKYKAEAKASQTL